MHAWYYIYEGLVRLRPRFCGKIDALGQNAPQSGPKCQGGGGITAYVVRPHAPDGAPTVGAARIGRGAVLERRAATCGLQNPLRPEWFRDGPAHPDAGCAAGLRGPGGCTGHQRLARQRAAAAVRPVAVALRCGGDLRPPLAPKNA